MKHTLDLSISNPCTEKWESFEPRPAGGFCGSCNKTVIDFTRMTDEQVIDFFNKASGHVCGRLRGDQLKSYAVADPVWIIPGLALFKASLVSLFLLLAAKAASAQSTMVKPPTEMVQDTAGIKLGELAIRERFTVSGVIQDELKEPIPGANILLKGTAKGTTAGADGSFTFPNKLDHGDVLIVSFMGYETLEYTVPRNCRGVDVSLPLQLRAEATSCTEVMYLGGVGAYRQTRIRRWWGKIKSIF